MRRLPLAFMVGLLTLSACANDPTGDGSSPPDETPVAAKDSPSSSAPSPVADPKADDPNSSCRGAATPPLGNGVHQMTISHDGQERSYRLFVPSSASEAKALPLVLNFHGLSGTADGQANASGLEDLAESDGFVAAHPQGTLNDDGLTFWDFLDTAPVDDVSFISAVIDDIGTAICIDAVRVYAMGHSNGGYLSSRLACDLSERITAVATVAATIHPDDCTPPRSVPLVAFHGTGDNIVPFDGGPSLFLGGQTADQFEPSNPQEQFLDYLFGLSIPTEVEEWADHNGCERTPETQLVDEAVNTSVISYQNCAAPTLLYVIEGGGHGWPTPHDSIDATTTAWAFLAAHQSPTE